MSEQAHRVVAIANGAYAKLAPLQRAVPDTSELVTHLKTEHGFDGVLLADLTQGDLLGKVTGALGRQSLQGGVLVVVWIGHGAPGPDGDVLLMSRADDVRDDEVASAAQLGAWAARTGASQVLVVVDTCFSGGGVAPALAMADAVIAGRKDPGSAWFGVVSASRADEESLSGALPRELKRLLTEGPKDERLRLRWGVYDARVRGDDVIDALLKEWSEDRHSPQQASTGNAWPMLRNPLYRPQAQHRVVEHLLQAARGTSRGVLRGPSRVRTRGLAPEGDPDERAVAQPQEADISFFTGRTSVLSRIVSWIARRAPGTCVVTGPAGSGKSAVLGRIASLSDSWERARLLTQDDIPDTLDPGEGTVSAQLHCRGLDTRTAVVNLAQQLELDADSSIYDILGLAARRKREGRPLMLVLDGLDEAGDTECRNLALEVVQPLSREALVLVGTREVSSGAGQPGLLALLGTTGETINLADDAAETMQDVRRYVVRRLESVSREMDPTLVADAIIEAAAADAPLGAGPFLFARLVTSQLRETPVDTSRADWRDRLPTGVEAALERDLEQTVLMIGGRAHPSAARELMRALACALGSGFPPDDVWPAVATALSPSGTTYQRDDVYALLDALARHVVAGSEGDQGVFRIAHQRLVDYLRPTTGAALGRRLLPEAARAIATAIAEQYESLLDQGQPPKAHPYLWRHAWRHLADAGPEGIVLLRRLVERDRDAFLPSLAQALAVVSSTALLRGLPKESVELQREAVDIQRQLGVPMELAMALYALSSALGAAEESEESDAAATEASDIARNATEQSSGRRTLAGTLTARVLSQLRLGNPRASVRVAQEAIELLESLVDEPEVRAFELPRALYLAAQSAQALGDMTSADGYSRRAITLLDAETESSDHRIALLVDALVIRAKIEVAELVGALYESGATGVRPADTRPRPLAAERVAILHRARQATGTILDVATAEGLRLLAFTMRVEGILGWASPIGTDPLALLNEALGLISPHAESNADAQVSLALVQLERAVQLLSTDARTGLAELASLEERLRSSARSAQLRAILGIVVDTSVAIATGGATEVLVDRQREAITLMSSSPDRLVRRGTVASWGRLFAMLEQLGRSEEAAEAREGSLEAFREAHISTLASALQLASLLADLTGGCVTQARPLEALAFAAEAHAVLAPYQASGQTGLPRGVCALNAGAALLALDRVEDARRSLEEALALLDVDSLRGVSDGWVGTALFNLSLMQLKADDFASALSLSTRALALLESPGRSASAVALALAYIVRGRALNETGAEDEGASVMAEGINRLRAIAQGELRAAELLAAPLSGADDAVWNAVLLSLADNPSLVENLQILRSRPVEQFGETVRCLHAALSEPELVRGRARYLRMIARRERARYPDVFDAHWQHAAGDVPEWLRIDPALDRLAVAWWNADSWSHSRDYLAAHPELLEPGSDTLLLELLDAGANPTAVQQRRGLLAKARSDGIVEAYAPLLARVAVHEWSTAGFSSEYLTDHLEELLSPSVSAHLSERRDAGDAWAGAVLGILTLTRRGEQYAAYRVQRDAAFAATQLQLAKLADDSDRLQALTALTTLPDPPNS